VGFRQRFCVHSCLSAGFPHLEDRISRFLLSEPVERIFFLFISLDCRYSVLSPSDPPSFLNPSSFLLQVCRERLFLFFCGSPPRPFPPSAGERFQNTFSYISPERLPTLREMTFLSPRFRPFTCCTHGSFLVVLRIELSSPPPRCLLTEISRTVLVRDKGPSPLLINYVVPAAMPQFFSHQLPFQRRRNFSIPLISRAVLRGYPPFSL